MLKKLRELDATDSMSSCFFQFVVTNLTTVMRLRNQDVPRVLHRPHVPSQFTRVQPSETLQLLLHLYSQIPVGGPWGSSLS